MPGQVARQSTQALTNATFPYILMLANGRMSPGLKKGVNVQNKKIKYEAVARDLSLTQYYQK